MVEEPAGRRRKNNMFSYGIMQGRLTPSDNRGIQFFPFDNWKEEFFTAKELGLQEIEWIFDYDNYAENPLWTGEGCEEINALIKETGICIHSICFDYYMRRPFYKYAEQEKSAVREENEEFFKKILVQMSKIGARLIEVPLVDNSSVKTKEEEQSIVEFLEQMAKEAERYGIHVGIESDYPPVVFRDFLEQFHVSNIVANYDSGNSSGLGYDSEKEITSLGQYLYNLHIKDRVFKGTTVALGTGSTDFEKVFSTLGKIGYHNSIILQAARGAEGMEKENIAGQLTFVKGYVNTYLQ